MGFHDVHIVWQLFEREVTLLGKRGNGQNRLFGQEQTGKICRLIVFASSDSSHIICCYCFCDRLCWHYRTVAVVLTHRRSCYENFVVVWA